MASFTSGFLGGCMPSGYLNVNLVPISRSQVPGPYTALVTSQLDCKAALQLVDPAACNASNFSWRQVTCTAVFGKRQRMQSSTSVHARAASLWRDNDDKPNANSQ